MIAQRHQASTTRTTTITGSAGRLEEGRQLPFERSHLEHWTELDYQTGIAKECHLLNLLLRSRRVVTPDRVRLDWIDAATFRIEFKWDDNKNAVKKAPPEVQGTLRKDAPGEFGTLGPPRIHSWSEGLYRFNRPVDTQNYHPELVEFHDESSDATRFVLRIRFETSHEEKDDHTTTKQLFAPPIVGWEKREPGHSSI